MRKHLLAILLPFMVAIFAFVVFNFTGYPSDIKNIEIDCLSDSKQQCLLENRRKKFSQKWQMDSLRKTSLIFF